MRTLIQHLKVWTLTATLVVAQTASSMELVISAAGDLSFSDNHLRSEVPDVTADRAWDRGKYYSYDFLTEHIEGLFWGTDLNFANVETVVANSKKGLRSPKAGQDSSKAYTFLSHPSSIQYVISRMNLNLFSLANNHSNDFGANGLAATLESMAALKKKYPYMEYAGIDRAGTSPRPIEFNFNGRRIAFAAVKSPNGGGSGDFKLIPMGSSSYQQLIRAFGAIRAEVKILSIHEGVEGKVTLDNGQASRYRSAVEQGGITIVLAHHPHVVRPVELYKGSVIYYSLGNFLILGAGNLDNRSDHYRNYGLVARTYLELGHGPARVTAIEAIPLKGMHLRPYVPEAKVAGTNIRYLNKLNQSEIGKNGVQFEVTSRGTGVACLGPGSGARHKKICR